MTYDEALRIVAISKAIGKLPSTARADVGVGTHEVDETVRIKGTVSIFEDEQYRPTAEIPIKATMALFIRYSGITRDAAVVALIQAMQDAVAMGDEGNSTDAILERVNEDWRVVEECMERVTQGLAQLPMKSRAGKITAKLICDPIPVAA